MIFYRSGRVSNALAYLIHRNSALRSVCPLFQGASLDILGLAFGVRWLDSALLACGFDAGPDCRREQKLPTGVSRAFRRQIVTKRAFQKRSKLFGPRLGRCQASATPRSRDRCSWLKNVQTP